MKYAAILGLAAMSAACAAAVGGQPVVTSAATQALAAQDGVDDHVVLKQKFPRKLSDFGFFADAANQVPASGVMSYRLNMPLFSDGAEKLRFLYLPAGVTAKADGEGLLDLPVGSALIKTFAFGDGADRRLIETRVLLHRADGWLALPYKWNDEQTEAKLVLAGARVDLTTPSGEEISYRVPNKNECKSCHGLNGEVIPIGPKARNLSHDWLTGLVEGGKLDAVPEKANSLTVWENRATSDLPMTARGYLEINCAHCHQPGATASNSGLDLRWEQHDRQAIGIYKRPVAAGIGSGGLEFDIVPGRPDDSIVMYRMRSNRLGVAMPELGKSTIDREGVDLIERWITEMKK